MMTPGKEKPAVVLAIDIGTSQVSAFAYDDDLLIHSGASRRVRAFTAPDGASWQSWPELHESLFDCVRAVMADAAVEVRALAMSGTASCLVTSWDDGGQRHVGEVVLWSDTRAAAEQRRTGSSRGGQLRTDPLPEPCHLLAGKITLARAPSPCPCRPAPVGRGQGPHF